METRTVALKNGETLTIRDAQTDDAEAVVHHVKAVAGETDNFPFGAEEFEGTAEAMRGNIQDALEKHNAVFMLAFIGEELVGLISLTGGKRLRNEHNGEMTIAVRQNHWGKGIGEASIRALIDWAHESGVIRKINLTVRADNMAAIGLYAKAGFVKEGVKLRDLFINGEFVDTCRMGMEIDPPLAAIEGGAL